MNGRGRKRQKRQIGFLPDVVCYKPCGKRGSTLERILLGHDELEALRLADYEGLYQEECAERMGISRSTFSRILQSAHKKVADALLHGKLLMIKDDDEKEAYRRDRDG
jgi:predicted DNA-binding protein (UPF0251 family)